MDETIFVGRIEELKRLRELKEKEIPCLAVVKGRRRVGKSRLIAKLAEMDAANRFWNFSGLAPGAGIGAQEQRDHFARQLSGMIKKPRMTFLDWSDAFAYLSSCVKKGDIVLFDEISWMGDKDPTFIPKLKVWWDKQVKPFLLVFCGSVSTWIEENILKSTAFFGRINLTLNLEPLRIIESAAMLIKMGMRCSFYDFYRVLSVLGGIPWYLEQINPALTVDENLIRLAFEKNGLLVTEFDLIFHDLFEDKGEIYKKIITVLQDGAQTLAEIRSAIAYSHSGTLSAMMEHLITAGFVKKQELWAIKTGKKRKQSLYRISDPFMRFYLKMIEPNLQKIEVNGFAEGSLSMIPGFEVHMGLQLEYLLLQNRRLILESLGIAEMNVRNDGPYRQFANASQKGCQIDYLVQTATNTLYLCEFKFRKREIGSEIIGEMQEKLASLKVPRGFAVVPVLFHLGGVSTAVELSTFFYRIVDIGDFVTKNG